ncbi:MAG: hypothetical protein IJD13_09100 [Oscillospiraceae bacterium]|nr:hypothetical protein [Oscillospiraceae bacterium]
MNRSLRPPKKIEVGTGNFKVRIILLIICLIAAAVFLGRGLHQLLNRPSGWQQVESTTKEVNCSADFTLNYYFGDAGLSVSAEYRQIAALYTEACEEGYRYFHREGELNDLLPGETVTVSEPLYEALRTVQDAGDRSLYLAPVYTEYDRIFLCETEAEAVLYDPARDEEIAAYIRKTAAFCNDPAMIDLKLLDGCAVRIEIADEYLAYAEENGIEEFLDFGWMKNAFIADHMAEKLIENGFTRGYIASYDGFTRNLDESGTRYSQNVFVRNGNLVDMPAVMEYQGPMSIVSLRDYPMGDLDRWHYFSFSDGRVVSVYLDPEGMNRFACHELLAFSEAKSCAEVLMEAKSVWMAETLDEARLSGTDGIGFVWAEDGTPICSSESVTLTAP